MLKKFLAWLKQFLFYTFYYYSRRTSKKESFESESMSKNVGPSDTRQLRGVGRSRSSSGSSVPLTPPGRQNRRRTNSSQQQSAHYGRSPLQIPVIRPKLSGGPSPSKTHNTTGMLCLLNNYVTYSNYEFIHKYS